MRATPPHNGAHPRRHGLKCLSSGADYLIGRLDLGKLYEGRPGPARPPRERPLRSLGRALTGSPRRQLDRQTLRHGGATRLERRLASRDDGPELVQDVALLADDDPIGRRAGGEGPRDRESPAHGGVRHRAACRDGQRLALGRIRDRVDAEIEDVGQEALDQLRGHEALEPGEQARGLCRDPGAEEPDQWHQKREDQAVDDATVHSPEGMATSGGLGSPCSAEHAARRMS
ncbi:hypothetical protein EV668_0216 [Enterovirga rhinocerotis]|uniref:Uncharacterized protein n=1 Tax=Enterovirga rhinocerotis TaxID=1339210 RepID=A0A4R7C525_9HYPH|nr:hypothetical protein EV668_0216 [Enterovirga rhinocerotis]